MRMDIVALLLLAGIAFAYGDGKFAVLTHPDHVQFVDTNQKIDSLEIPYIITNLFGLPSSLELKWDGLLEGNLFLKPKALALFSVFLKEKDDMIFDGAQKSYETTKKNLGLDDEHIINMIEQVTWEKEPLIIQTAIQNQLLDIKSTLEKESASLSLDNVLEEIQSTGWLANHDVKNLNVSSDADLAVLAEIFAITKAVQMIKNDPESTKNPSPDFFHFKVTGLRSIEDEQKLKEAKKVLKAVVNEATEALKLLYNNNVVIATLVLPSEPIFSEGLGRHLQARSTFLEDQAKISEAYNFAPQFDEIYPVTFNIILWFSIAFGLTILGVSWGIWNMDPGLDSVIYRMTGQRLKRD